MATVTINYYGVEASGKNVTEAKRNAGKLIESAMTANYAPEILAHRDHAFLLYRDPTGWRSCLVADSEGFRAGRLYGGFSADATFDDVRQSALRQLAQLGWQLEDGTDAPEFITERRDREDFARWAEFQTRYQEGIRLGLSGDDAHSYAGRNPARADLWAVA